MMGECLAYEVLLRAVQCLLSAKGVAIPLLQRFAGVYIEDGSSLLLPDGLAWAAVFFGALRIGAVAVPLNTRLDSAVWAAMLADSANRDVIVQVVRRYVSGVERIDVQAGGAGPGGVAEHPEVQAAVAEFQGEVVAVRPRQPEGEGQ